MNLMDMIVGSRAVLPRRDVRASRHDAVQLRSCPLRYVLDEGASRQCADLLRECPDLMTLERDVLRLPATRFWLEWPAEDDGNGSSSSGVRLGCLVEASEDGRSGTVFPYYSTRDNQAQRLPGCIQFDLDNPCTQNGHGSRSFTHRLFPHLNQVLAHAVMTMDSGWVRAAARLGEATLFNKMTVEAEGSWFYLPFLLTFSVLLFSPSIIRERHTNAERSGAAQTGRARTLDHIEVTMRLGEHTAWDSIRAHREGSRRGPPRLHVVRGHYVSRGSKKFWRMSHLRGSGEWSGYSKTVKVKAARLMKD